MDNRRNSEDYRQIVISKWVEGKIESFKMPTLDEFEKQFNYYSYLIDRYLSNLVKKDAEILEIGCGWGPFIYALKKLGYSNIEAIDVIPECCEFVNREFGINIVCSDAINYFASKINKKFDVIVAFDVVEHLNKMEIIFLMQKIYESLKDNGVFIMRVPNGGSLNGLYIRYSGFTHELAFTCLSINEIFKVASFSDVICIPESEIQKRSPIKRFLRRTINKFVAKVFYLDPRFIDSANIIGIALK